MIFGQHDPGKTPYNSWGKPVWKLLFIFWILLLQWCRNLHSKKTTATSKQSLSQKSCQTPPWFSCPQNRKITAEITAFKTIRTSRKHCRNGCTASLEICSFLSSKFVPTYLELRALPCCMDFLKVSVATLLLTSQKILFKFLLLLLSICSWKN